MLLDGQVGQEPIDVTFRKFPGMLAPVELDVPTSPMDVGFFRTAAVTADPQNSHQVIVEPGRGLSWKQPQRL